MTGDRLTAGTSTADSHCSLLGPVVESCAAVAPYTKWSDQSSDPHHGNACFKPGGFKGGGDWSCPAGCTKVHAVPYCVVTGTMTPCRVPQGFPHIRFKSEDWYLVRRDHDPSDGWHQANDNLAGTAVYGSVDPSWVNPRGDPRSWSVGFGHSFTKYLLASGDLSMWVVLGKNELASKCAANCAGCTMTLDGSYMFPSTVYALEYCRRGAAEDPWISAGNHPTGMVYGENSYVYYNVHDALNFLGANVWVNVLP